MDEYICIFIYTNISLYWNDFSLCFLANSPLADFHDGTAIPCTTSDCTTVGW